MRIRKKFTARNGEIAVVSGVSEFWQWAGQHGVAAGVSRLPSREAICRHWARAIERWWMRDR